MNCTRFEQSLNRVVETRCEDELRELRDHAATCSLCRGMWQQFALLQQAIPLWKSDLPDVDLADSVILRVATSTPAANPATRRSYLKWSSVAAVAAAACVLAFAVWPVAAPNDQAPQDPQLADVESPQPPSQATAAPQTPERAVREGGDAIMVLAGDAADAVAHTPIFLPVDALSTPEAEQSDDARASSWINDWSEDLQPIGREVGNAMNFLLDAVPLEPAPTI